jgi:carboxyl-terminal processing protease
MQPNPQTTKFVLITFLLVILAGVVGYQIGQRDLVKPTEILAQLRQEPAPEEYQDVSLKTFWEVWGQLEADYLRTEKIDAEKMVDGAIGGMTAALGDPYTVYLPPEEDKRAEEELAGSFYGVGIELGYIENTLAVVAPIKGMPADLAGIKSGDLILHVKDEAKNLDEDTSGWALTEAVSKIRGDKGSEVTLTLYRRAEEASQPFEVKVRRDEIVVRTVELTFVEQGGKKAAHISLSRFGERTQSEWNEAVQQILAEQNVDGVILDMRNNPGGFFDTAIDISSDFIEKGVAVSQKGKLLKQDYQVNGNARLVNYPVEVLVNRGSASASEIVAGALRDQKGAKLYGEKTFGKGTVQDRRQLSNGGGLHVTIAQWLLPKGDSIHETGIPADVEVADDLATPDVDEVLQKAIQDL